MAELTLPFHPEAEIEVFDALDFYDELDVLQGTRLAAGLQLEIDTALGLVGELPRSFPPYALGTRRCLLRRFPYALVFDIEPEAVVLAFAHTKRRPGYWRGRRLSRP